jgi:hypothetical protein
MAAMLAEIDRLITRLRSCEAKSIARWKLATAKEGA